MADIQKIKDRLEMISNTSEGDRKTYLLVPVNKKFETNENCDTRHIRYEVLNVEMDEDAVLLKTTESILNYELRYDARPMWSGVDFKNVEAVIEEATEIFDKETEEYKQVGGTEYRIVLAEQDSEE